MCLQCAVCCRQQNTEIFQHSSLVTTCMASLVMFKDFMSESNSEAELLCTIRVILESCVCRKKLWRMVLPKCGMSHSSIQRMLETYYRHYYKAKCVGTNWVATNMDREWIIRKGRGGLLGTEQLRLSVTRPVVTLL